MRTPGKCSTRRAGNQYSSEGTSTLIIRALMISALMISVAPSVPPVSVHHCHLSLPINASCQCPSVHINATYQCPSELPFSENYQCQSMPPISASQCHL
ncbi:unnamed protein product [Staurois parvus]|uniref:Uncharacterized protein n=1 Tax=Staurois parvus TaxID=386267 RepID=A0ABN9FSM8_9NEOB|nr:unnamed protein product [Staurois parvus]